MRRSARTILLPAALTLLALASQYLPTIALVNRPLPDWLPSLGSRAVTVVAYRELIAALGTLVVLAGALALGYREAHHRDVGPVYLRYVGVVCAAGAAALLLTFGGAVVASDSAGSSPFLTALIVTARLVAIPGVLTVSALAGVALALTRGEDDRARSVRELLPVAVAAGVVTGAGYVLESAGDLAMAAGDAVGVAAWLPQFGTVGTTAVIYIRAGRIAGDLALLGGGIVLGVLAVRRIGVAAPSRRFVAATALGALGGLLVAWISVIWFVVAGNGGQSSPTVASVAASIPITIVSTVVITVLAVVTGLGVARFESDGSDTGGSEDADDSGFDAVTETPVSERSLRDH